MLRAQGRVPVSYFVFERTVFLSYASSILLSKFSHHSFSPYIFFFATCSFSDCWLLVWSHLEVWGFTFDNFLRIKWIGPSEIWEILLMNAWHIVFHTARSSVSVVSYCKHVVVCSYSFEIAFHAQSCHTLKQIQSRGWLSPISVSVLVTLVSDCSTLRKDCRGASRYGYVGTIGIPLARSLQGFLFVVREKCNQLLHRFRMIFKCVW